jgi:hypothetical protein
MFQAPFCQSGTIADHLISREVVRVHRQVLYWDSGSHRVFGIECPRGAVASGDARSDMS